MKELALSNKSIIRLKEAKKAHDADKMKMKIEKTLCIKYPFYFILGFILQIFIWYYLSMFGVIYRNTQYHLIKDTLVGYGLSLIYPFFIFYYLVYLEFHLYLILKRKEFAYIISVKLFKYYN